MDYSKSVKITQHKDPWLGELTEAHILCFIDCFFFFLSVGLGRPTAQEKHQPEPGEMDR